MRNVLRLRTYNRILRVKAVVPPIHCAKLAFLLALVISQLWSPSNVQLFAQETGVGTYSRLYLVHLARQMRERPDNSENAKSGLLEKHLDPVTILAVRTKSGRAELHTASSDSFFVIEGNATLVTGGSIVNPEGKEEVRGDSVRGGTRAKLAPGDVVHIPTSTPHQVLLDDTGAFVYVLIKTLAH
jgi:mannose-6-phosphate isomerase-like protein (cupin superfamily)